MSIIEKAASKLGQVDKAGNAPDKTSPESPLENSPGIIEKAASRLGQTERLEEPQGPPAFAALQSTPENRLLGRFPNDPDVDRKHQKTFFKCFLTPTAEDDLVRVACNAQPSAKGW